MIAARLALFVATIGALAFGATWYVAARADPAVLVQKAEARLQADDWEAARALVQRLERLRPPTPNDRLLRARIDVAAKDDAGALDELRHITDDRELAPRALFMTGVIERRRKRPRLAEAAYRKAIALDPRLIAARKELIYILGMQSRRRELDAEFRALSRITPLTNYDLYIWCLTHFINWGAESADDIQEFVTADPDDRQSRLATAALLLAKPDQDARLEEILKPLPPEDPEVLAIRAERELNRGRADEAERMIAGAKTDDPRIARLRARLAFRRGDRDGAVGYFRQALSGEPYDRVANSELGKALLVQGNRAEAEVYLSRARNLDEVYNLVTRLGRPKQNQSTADLKRLARACEAAGLSAEARGWYMLAISQDPLDHEAQQALHRISQATTTPLPANPGK